MTSVLFSMGDKRYMQYLAAISASIGITSGCTFLTWPSPTLPQLFSENSPIGVTLTREEGSWVVSILLLAGAISSPLVAVLVDQVGRRKSLLISGVLFFIPWILILLANHVWFLYIARAIAGVGLSLTTTAISIYNGEIADNDIRGQLSTMFNTLAIFGSLLVLLVGPFVTYTTLALLCATIPLIFISAFYFMPESPYYLVKMGEIGKAKMALRVLASRDIKEDQLDARLFEIEVNIARDMKNKASCMEFFTGKQYRRLIFITIGIKTLQQMCGQNAIDSYMQTIIVSTGSSLSPEVISIIYGLVQIPSSILAATVVDKFGRKPMLITSAIGCAIALISEGTYFYLQEFYPESINSLSWLPPTAIIFFVFMSTFGVLNIPYVLMGEIFPTNIKSVAVTSAGCYGGFLGFAVSKMFDPISRAWGTYSIFWIYATSCIVGTIFVFFYVPETKGKTFAEIQRKIGRVNGLEIAAA